MSVEEPPAEGSAREETTTPPHSQSPVQTLGAPTHGEPSHRPALTALARLVHAVADLAAAFETTLAEWSRKARKDRKRA